MELSSIVSSDITVTWNSTLVEFPETENIVFLSSSVPDPGLVRVRKVKVRLGIAPRTQNSNIWLLDRVTHN